MPVGQQNDAKIYGVVGASGSGKSLYVKTVLLKPKPARLMVWNYQHEDGYTALCTTSTTSLKAVATAAKKARFSIDFHPNHGGDLEAQFALFCRIAHAVPDVTLVVEELSFVTKPSYAPPAWRAVCATGRHTGMTIIGIAQRPAMTDKTFFSQCTTVRTGRMNFATDQRTMAGMLSCDHTDIANLQPLDYIQKDMSTGAVIRGRVKIPASLRKP